MEETEIMSIDENIRHLEAESNAFICERKPLWK